MMLNMGTKYWFYEKANALICKVFYWDPEAKNIVKKPKVYGQSDLSLQIRLSKAETETQENCVMATTFFLGIFFSLMFNYCYSMFLQEIMVSTLFLLILIFIG